MGSFSEIYKSFLLEKKIDDYQTFSSMFDDYENNDLKRIYNLFKFALPAGKQWPKSSEVFPFARDIFKRPSSLNLKQNKITFNGKSGDIETFNLFYLIDFLFFLQEENRGKEDYLLALENEETPTEPTEKPAENSEETTETSPTTNLSSSDLRVLLSRLFKS